MNEQKNKGGGTLNKELILREFLAIERTKMANNRTLLSFLRTGLYFLVAGSTLEQVTNTAFWKYLGLPFVIIGVVMMAIGTFVFLRSKRKIVDSGNQIGQVKDEFISSVMQSS